MCVYSSGGRTNRLVIVSAKNSVSQAIHCYSSPQDPAVLLLCKGVGKVEPA